MLPLFPLKVFHILLDLVLEVFPLVLVELDESGTVSLISVKSDSWLEKFFVLRPDISLKILFPVKGCGESCLGKTQVVAGADARLVSHLLF